MYNPHPCQSLSMTNKNLKSPKSSTPRLTTDIMPANYCISSVGQGMRQTPPHLPGKIESITCDLILNLTAQCPHYLICLLLLIQTLYSFLFSLVTGIK